MMAAIPVVSVEAGSGVTLVVPPPLVVQEEKREARLPVSLGGGAHGSPTWSELEGSRGAMARVEVVHPHRPAGHGVLVVDIPIPLS